VALQFIVPRPDFRVLVMSAIVLFVVILLALALALAAYVALSSRHQKSSRLPLNLVGRVGSVERALRPEGFVLVGGELWPARARGGGVLECGRANVRVVGAAGCLLEVEAVEGDERDAA
jgi:membrane protein implicated in regulation of membrane protease activity